MRLILIDNVKKRVGVYQDHKLLAAYEFTEYLTIDDLEELFQQEYPPKEPDAAA